MSEQKVWPSRDLADAVLGDVATTRAYVADMAHRFTGDDNKPTQAALVAVVGHLDDLAVRLQDRLGVPAVTPTVFSDAAPREWPAVEPGLVTGDVVKRMRGNRGRHAAGPK